MSWDFKPQPQTKKEFDKNSKRITDLLAKAGGDKEKEISLAKTMANSIDTPEKAYNRGHVAKEMGKEHIFEVFYARAFELGSVTLAEHRDHTINRIFEDVDVMAIPDLTEDETLRKIDNKNYTDVEWEKVPSIIIKNISKIITKNFEDANGYDLSKEEEKDERDRLLKRLTLSRLEKILEAGEAAIGITKNDNHKKIYHFEMDSDSIRFACEMNLSEDGYSYCLIDW